MRHIFDNLEIMKKAKGWIVEFDSNSIDYGVNKAFVEKALADPPKGIIRVETKDGVFRWNGKGFKKERKNKPH